MSLSRSFSGCVAAYPIRLPFGTQPETSWGGSKVAPRNGTTFGCLKCFHMAAPLHNICGVHLGEGLENNRDGWHTFPTPLGSPFKYTHTFSTRTLKPPRDPSCRSVKAPDAKGWLSTLRRVMSKIAQDFGSILRVPHKLPSSCRHVTKSGLVGCKDKI